MARGPSGRRAGTAAARPRTGPGSRCCAGCWARPARAIGLTLARPATARAARRPARARARRPAARRRSGRRRPPARRRRQRRRPLPALRRGRRDPAGGRGAGPAAARARRPPRRRRVVAGAAGLRVARRRRAGAADRRHLPRPGHDGERPRRAGRGRPAARGASSSTGLDPADVAQLVAARVPGTPPESLARELHQRTSGNPLFVDELLGLVEREGPPRAGGDVPLPAGVRDAIGRRLEPLGAPAGTLLQVAAVVGGKFRLETVAAAAGLPAGEAFDHLEEAIAGGFVDDVPGTAEPTFAFTHGLVRETIYDGLSRRRRAELHATVAAVLERRYAAAPEAHLAEVAHHLFEALPFGDRARAHEFARGAGERALGLAAWEEAVRASRSGACAAGAPRHASRPARGAAALPRPRPDQGLRPGRARHPAGGGLRVAHGRRRGGPGARRRRARGGRAAAGRRGRRDGGAARGGARRARRPPDRAARRRPGPPRGPALLVARARCAAAAGAPRAGRGGRAHPPRGRRPRRRRWTSARRSTWPPAGWSRPRAWRTSTGCWSRRAPPAVSRPRRRSACGASPPPPSSATCAPPASRPSASHGWPSACASRAGCGTCPSCAPCGRSSRGAWPRPTSCAPPPASRGCRSPARWRRCW